MLILSGFAGASRELSEALIVNPYDVHAVAELIGQALRMPEAEQRERMRLMREIVRRRNVYRWAGQMLLDAAQLRKRQKIMQMVSRDLKSRGIQHRSGHCTRSSSVGSPAPSERHAGRLQSLRWWFSGNTGVLSIRHSTNYCEPYPPSKLRANVRCFWGRTCGTGYGRGANDQVAASGVA